MKYGLYIKNHKKLSGLEDYVYFLRQLFSRNKINLELVDKKDNEFDVILVIEEFTHNIKENNEFLLWFKKRGTKLVLVHTEFIDENGFFNIFNEKDLSFRKLIKADLIYFYYKNKNNLFIKILLYIFYFYYLNLGFVFGFRFKDIKKRIYFALRDYSFNLSKNIFDYHLALSDNVYINLLNNSRLSNIFYLQSFIDKKFIQKLKSKNEKNLILYLTGFKSPYRNKFVSKINRIKFNNFINNNFTYNYKYVLESTDLYNLNFMYTSESNVIHIFENYKAKLKLFPLGIDIYISQRENWSYISAMRTLRSIKSSSIPLNIGNYSHSNFNKIAINVYSMNEFLDNLEYLLSDYLENIDDNTRIFNNESDSFFKAFIEAIF